LQRKEHSQDLLQRKEHRSKAPCREKNTAKTSCREKSIEKTSIGEKRKANPLLQCEDHDMQGICKKKKTTCDSRAEIQGRTNIGLQIRKLPPS
jgi:hypothetical protein